MYLNCDMGELLDGAIDALLMPHIDQASIACGGHAGDATTMRRTLALARRHKVAVGAHPSYNDIEGFGRRSYDCSSAEIKRLICDQTAVLAEHAAAEGIRLSYVKPHGALYNDMMAKAEVRAAVMASVVAYDSRLPLVLQATPQQAEHLQEAQALGVSLWFEAFADRRYDDSGLLRSRQLDGAVLNRDAMLAQVKQLCESGSVTTHTGNNIRLHADTLCVHGDNPEAATAIAAIKACLRGAQ